MVLLYAHFWQTLVFGSGLFCFRASVPEAPNGFRAVSLKSPAGPGFSPEGTSRSPFKGYEELVCSPHESEKIERCRSSAGIAEIIVANIQRHRKCLADVIAEDGKDESDRKVVQ